MRCTIGRATASFDARRPGVPLWKLELADYLAWIEGELSLGGSPECLAKKVGHLSCCLT